MLVVQGARDPFGMPPAAPRREIAVVQGDHSLRTDVGSTIAAVHAWLTALVAGSGP